MNRILGGLLIFLLTCCTAYSSNNTASVEFSVYVPQYLSITPMTSPVLVAHVHDNTGNLHTPLSTKFRVTTNKSEATLYLNAKMYTDNGEENALFTNGNQVYMAFGNIQEIPSSQALLGCKYGNESKGVVAYPVISIYGMDNKFIPSKEKYELYVRSNGTYYVSITVGTSILRSSFDNQDKKGFYQATVFLTETDI